MQRLTWVMCCAVAALMFCSLAMPACAADANEPALGRWDITLGDGPTPCWLEITKKDGQYAGRFLHIAASVFDLKSIKVDGAKIEFAAIDTEGGDRGLTFTGTVEGDSIKGETVNKKGEKGKWSAQRFVAKLRLGGTWKIEGEDKGTFRFSQASGARLAGVLMQSGNRSTPLTNLALDGYQLAFTVGEKKGSAQIKGEVMEGTMGEEKFVAKHQIPWAKPIELFNGKDLAGWKALEDPNNFQWKVVDGIMHCDGHSSNIVSEQKFEDFKLHVEFKVPKDGNSGVYLRGRYEIQVADSAGQTPNEHSCAALYSRIAASEDAGKPAGEWQTYDITVIDHHVTVVWNGKTVINNRELEGITGGAMDSKEAEPGPIYLQGDHAAIDYRKITVTPAKYVPGGRVSG